MADTAIEKTATAEVTAKELKEKKEATVKEEGEKQNKEEGEKQKAGEKKEEEKEEEEEKKKDDDDDEEEEEKADNGEAPANGTNGADHSEKVEKKAEEKHKNGDDGDAEVAPPAEETDAQPVKRAVEEEEEVGCHQAEKNPSYNMSKSVFKDLDLSEFHSSLMLKIFLFSLLNRKRWRQKSRRPRKMEIQKRQKWRLRSLLLVCSTVQPAWSTSCCRACAFCTF
ncbi:uncharacterized protein ACO6RY_08800 [Pungitius sinensis]